MIKYIYKKEEKRTTYGAFKIGPIVRLTQGGKSVQYTNSRIQGNLK